MSQFVMIRNGGAMSNEITTLGDAVEIDTQRVQIVFIIPSNFDAESFIDELVACYSEMNPHDARLVSYEWARGVNNV